MLFIGIDPGLHGAVGIVDKRKVEVFDTPTMTIKRARGGKKETTRGEYDLHAMASLLERYANTVGNGPADLFALIEHVGSRPEQSAQSTFMQGFGIGVWEAILATLRIRYVRIGPQRWKRAMVPNAPGDKQAAIAEAKRLFPSVEFHGRLGGAKDGRAEALLMAEYLRRQHIQGKL